jgi:uncharacterized protein (DUF488 family)
MRTSLFRDAAAALASRAHGLCVMCAESDPADCHRSHIADWLVAHGRPVAHLLALGRSVEHARNPQEELWRED